MTGGQRYETQPLPRADFVSLSGLEAATVVTGVKSNGALDLALLCARGPRTAAGVFTKNAVPAAPVVVSRRQLDRHDAIRAVVINSGNANALTGERGLRDAEEMIARVEAHCGAPALVFSTGIIGVPLPREDIFKGIDLAAGRLGNNQGLSVARAILTTDTRPKQHSVRVFARTDRRPKRNAITVTGIAKGSGMIHPNMATMLAFMVTEAPVVRGVLDGILRRAVDQSFHQISVDGDTSTNDAVLLIAGEANAKDAIDEDDPRLPMLERAVTEVAGSLADQILWDGEGMTRLLRVEVNGAASNADARAIAASVARSALVKTALAGGDPNWGRVLAAAGNAGVPLATDELSLCIGGVQVFAAGRVLDFRRSAVLRAFRQREVKVVLRIGSGAAGARFATTDLTHGYVSINSEYPT